MNDTKTSAFQFKGYKIVRSLIELNSEKAGENFNITFNSKGTINKAESTFQLDLSVLIKNKEDSLKIEVETVSNFSFDSQIEITQLNKYFYMNAPAILFPYIRAYISTLSVLSGIEPITLPTLNLSGLGKELEKNTVAI